MTAIRRIALCLSILMAGAAVAAPAGEAGHDRTQGIAPDRITVAEDTESGSEPDELGAHGISPAVAVRREPPPSLPSGELLAAAIPSLSSSSPIPELGRAPPI